MNSLLIHNDNVAFIGSFEASIKFSISSDIDHYISNTILSEIKTKTPNMIFIKDNLSSNYLELYGLRLAYHIRFEEKLKFVPIVILSDLDGFTLNRFEPMAKILFTHNVFIIKNNKKAFDDFKKKKIMPFNEDEYKRKFLDLINVEPPENSTNHSIANEWAIDRWGMFLGIENKTMIKKNKEKIASLLYYKYLKEKYFSSEATQKNIKQKITEEVKILFIDDKGKDGWNEIMESYVSQHYVNIQYQSLKNKDNNINIYADIDSIKVTVKEQIKKYDPHIILLDLRLLENESKTISQISGIKIFKYIKELNKSIQIIIFTASTDSLIIDTLYDEKNEKILGYIKKDAPTDKYEASKNSFNKLDTLIKKGIEKKYLKEIWSIQKKILELKILQSSNENYKKIKDEIDTVFEILDSNLENKMKFTILTIFKVIEILIEEYSINNQATYDKFLSLFQKFNLNKYNHEISQLICTRNFLAHAGDFRASCKNSVVKKPTKNHILDWFKMLQTILFEIDKK